MTRADRVAEALAADWLGEWGLRGALSSEAWDGGLGGALDVDVNPCWK